MISRSQRFLIQVQNIIETHLNDPAFTVAELSQVMRISESTLRRKFQQYAGMTPKQYIKQLRLYRAKELLENDVGFVSEIATAAGFANHSYFAKCFQEQFGVLPSQYRN